MTSVMEKMEQETAVDKKSSQAVDLVKRIDTLLESPKIQDIREAIDILRKAEEKYTNERSVLDVFRNRRVEFEDELKKALNELVDK